LLIVIEGPDRTGKTTLANRLAEAIGGEVLHKGAPTRTSIEEYETELDGYDPRGKRHLVLDRWHVGESVWPRFFGRKSDYDLATQRHVEMFMESRGAVIVYANRDPVKLRRELVEFNEPLKPENLDLVNRLYTEARVFAGRPVHWWDYEHSTAEDFLEIVSHAEMKAEILHLAWDACGPGFVCGVPPQLAKVLLVGDELGPEKEGREPPEDVPFAPYLATSGHYLLRALHDWRHFAIVNSLENRTGKVRDLRQVVGAFRSSRIVALGGRAHLALQLQGIDHTTVPHPQFHRRFKFNEINEYTRLLEGG
jgi:hypothetical protein